MIWTLALAAKSTLVLGAATAGAWALRRSSASIRHVLWTLVLLCIVALPVLSTALPPLRLPLLPAPVPDAARQLETVVAGLEGTPSPLDRAALPSRRSWQDWALLAWLAGAILGLIQLASGSLFVARAIRRAQPVMTPEWNVILDEARTTLGIRRRVEVRFSHAVNVPNVWGYRSPVVLLPWGAESWPEGRRRAILFHELAHVARHDCLTQTLAYVVRAFYWPHPLVWWAVSSLRREAECACDDRVLQAGTAAPEYARDLLEAARGLGRPASPFLTAAAGAEGTRLGDRVRALLNDDRDRRVPTRRATALLGAGTLLAIAFVAAAEPVAARTAGSPPDEASTDTALGDWIVHEPYGCLIERQFPEIDAVIEPASEVAEARLCFASAASDEETWFWVKMTRTGAGFVGRLPRPQAAASPVQYRIEAHRTDGRVASTERHAAVVVTTESQCPEGVRVAPVARSTEAVTVHTAKAPR